MALNRVGIDGYNIPQLSIYEPFLHSLPEVTCSLTWGGGYPGSGGTVSGCGQLHLTPFRLIWIPEKPSERLYSLVIPLTYMEAIDTDIICFSDPDVNGARNYLDPASVPTRYRGADGFYDLTKMQKSYYLRARVRPLRNNTITDFDEAREFLGLKPLPPSAFLTIGLLTKPGDLHLTIPAKSSCALHRHPLSIKGPRISCHVPDFLFSFIKAYNIGAEITGGKPLTPKTKKAPRASRSAGYEPLLESEELQDLSAPSRRSHLAPRAPLQLAYSSVSHTMQDMTVFDSLCRTLGLEPPEVYNENPPRVDFSGNRNSGSALNPDEVSAASQAMVQQLLDRGEEEPPTYDWARANER